MPEKKIIGVFGAIGIQGGSVVKAILNDPRTAALFSVRAITRNAAKPLAQDLVSQGVEVVSASFGNKTSLIKALSGVYGVYLVTDFWSTLSKDIEIAQGKNVADAAKECNIQHLIFSSLPSATALSNSHLTKVHHFDSKATIESYIRMLGIPTTFLYPGFYMNNLPGQRLSFSASTKSWTLSLPVPGDTRLPLFAAELDTGKFVKAILLNRDELLGERIYAATAYVTPLEIIESFKESFPEVGQGTRFEQMKTGEWETMLRGFGMASVAVEDLSEMMQLFAQFGYFGGEELEESLAILSEPLTSWKQYIERSEAFKGLK
ncbi:hypothetical protein B0O99DRAFT_714091 [Bisporella sp. PMI_857]|nr:hypothetical protein B0O99DRAFT_714091 [Bisporella sp. PMI_857]